MKTERTLDEFIARHTPKLQFPNNEWVSCEGFTEMYVRMCVRFMRHQSLYPTLDIANVTAKKPGQGTFTRLISRLRSDHPYLHIFVEQATNEFGVKLVRMGFERLPEHSYGKSFLLRTSDTFREA